MCHFEAKKCSAGFIASGMIAALSYLSSASSQHLFRGSYQTMRSFQSSVSTNTDNRLLEKTQACLLSKGKTNRNLAVTGAIITNGLIKLGITDKGALNVPGGQPTPPEDGQSETMVGLRYIFPDGRGEGESTSYGCTCEGWGVGADGESISFNTDRENESPPTSAYINTFTSTASTAIANLLFTSGKLKVTHDFHPASRTRNLYEVTVTIQNTSGGTISDIPYRRVFDWDIFPTPFHECSTVQPHPSTVSALVMSSNDGFMSANPYAEFTSIPYGRSDGFNNFTDLGPQDQGASFQFQFGPLSNDSMVTFHTYYGAAANEAEATAALEAVGAEVYSIAKPSDPVTGVCVDTPNVYIFGFAAVGGKKLFSAPQTTSNQPSSAPTVSHSEVPSVLPSHMPSHAPSTTASQSPSIMPSSAPSSMPSNLPSLDSSANPSNAPSNTKSLSATLLPSSAPSAFPSKTPSEDHAPRKTASQSPSMMPSSSLSSIPSSLPSLDPSSSPSESPSKTRSQPPSLLPSSAPSAFPSKTPSQDHASQETASKSPSIMPSSVPSSIPSSLPSSDPLHSPSGAPSKTRSQSTSLLPSSAPSAFPSKTPGENHAPHENGSQSPSITPSSAPSSVPSSLPSLDPLSSPSDAPSKTRSQSPSFFPSSAPSAFPSKTPSQDPSMTISLTPSVEPSAYPNTMVPITSRSHIPSHNPTASPTAIPRTQPLIVEEQVEIPGSVSTSFDICTLSINELSDFSSATVATIQSIACSAVNNTCVADITSVCGAGSTRRLLSSRYLQTQNWQIDYVVKIFFKCNVASCRSPADKGVVSTVVASVSTQMVHSIVSGSFLALLSTNIVQLSGLDRSITSCLVVWGTVQDAVTEVGDPGTGVFYPDWENDSGTCLQDGNEPEYMKNNTVWLFGSIEECCSHYFPGWNFNKCMNPKGSGLWYLSHLEGKCVTDCEEGNGKTCGGLASAISDNLYSNPRSCCESELPWRFVDFCEADSFLSTCYAGTGLYYRGDSAGQDVCVRDCDLESGDSTCGGLVEETYVVLHDSAEACCTSEYNWIDVELCASRSTQTSINKYWPDMVNGKCLDVSKMPPSDLSVTLFDSVVECCNLGIFWLSEKNCLAASGINVTVANGSEKFYVHWANERCVKDCIGLPPCGGFAQMWDILYDSGNDCCEKISWVPLEKCLSA